jgi:hypothetical protein
MKAIFGKRNTVTVHLSTNTCVMCCFVCKNKNCKLCGSTRECERCSNYNCINSGKYDCMNYYDCFNCTNIHCVDHQRFNPMEEFAKYC